MLSSTSSIANTQINTHLRFCKLLYFHMKVWPAPKFNEICTVLMLDWNHERNLIVEWMNREILKSFQFCNFLFMILYISGSCQLQPQGIQLNTVSVPGNSERTMYGTCWQVNFIIITLYNHPYFMQNLNMQQSIHIDIRFTDLHFVDKRSLIWRLYG